LGADVIRISRYIHHVLLSNGALGAALRLLCFHLDGVYRNLFQAARILRHRSVALKTEPAACVWDDSGGNPLSEELETLSSIAWTAQTQRELGRALNRPGRQSELIASRWSSISVYVTQELRERAHRPA
jgi:hypothetical protein